MTAERPITFLTDFGLQDEFAGVCRAVIHRIDPRAEVIELTHGIAPGDVRRGALALEQAIHYSAPAVHLAVVDPGVGTGRRAVALEAGDHYLVGPDNGLLSLAAARVGGVTRAVDISESPFRLTPTHRTFHGRDIFSPVAANLTLGTPLDELGPELDPGTLARLSLPSPELDGDLLIGHVLTADRYGNLGLNIGPELILESFLRDGETVAVEVGGAVIAEVPFGSTFGDVEAGRRCSTRTRPGRSPSR